MDFGGRTKKTSPKRIGSDFIDMTILSTPRPQASSTVERKTFYTRYSHAPFESINPFDESTNSSLGLVNNISTLLEDHEQSTEESNTMIVNKLEAERKLARQLLQRCDSEGNDDKLSLGLDTNKENDVNAQNMSMTKLNQSTKLSNVTTKFSLNNVNFEPNEFTARSSEMSKSNSDNDDAKSNFESKNNINGFSFNSTAAEIMAKFADDDFISGSRISNQFAADELSCQQNFNSIPIATENERLEFSCFSGIIGDMDLTVDSGTNHKLSVGEYFSRKCGTLGQLSNSISGERPSFGLLEIKSPKRTAKAQPLVNITTSTVNDESSVCVVNEEMQNTTDGECSIMSLSKIAQALQSADGTPRRLIDQLLMAKKKSVPNSTINCTSNTYTLPTTRTSLPAVNSSSLSSSSSTSNTENNYKSSKKLSLDSKTLTDSINDIKFINNDSPHCKKSNPVNPIKVELLKNSMSKDHIQDDTGIMPLSSTSPSSPLTPRKPKTQTYTKSESPFNNNHNNIKEEQKSIISLSRFNEKIIIGKNTQELYKCIIGVSRMADIEIQNDSERWLICKLRLQQIQGDKNNVEIDVPKTEILIEPRKSNITKITVKLLKIGDPIMASLAIDIKDMSTHEIVTKQHMMCFVPQESRNNEPLPIINIDLCEIHIIDTQMPITLRKNETKCLRIKNISKEIVTLSAIIVQSDEPQKIFLSIEPRNMTLRSGEINDIIIQCQGVVNENIASTSDAKDNGHASMKIKTANNIYSYPIIIKINSSNDENRMDYVRCVTPQHSALTAWGNVSPSSPHSTSSTKSGRNSPRSTTSGQTVASDTIPIKSTNSSLIWTSVRVGKHETREFTIRNTSNNKIKLQAIITDNDNSFKFLKDRDMSTIITVGLQHMESKTFTVIFSPNNIGPIAGRITFMHYNCKRDNKESRSPKIIPLYGYGGYARVSISQAMKIMGDQMWLSLGKLNSSGVLNSRIKLENSGDLCAYARISLVPKAIYPSVETSWHIEPTELLLGPKEIRWVDVQFRPRKEDLAVLHGEVADMGTLTITHGDEPTRWRIRRLYKKLCDSGEMKKRNQDDIFSNVVYPICTIFPGETPINNLSILRDSPQDLGTLCRRVNRHVVTLTVEINVDDTIPIFHDDYDDTNESQMFQSLRSDITVLGATNDNSYMPSESILAIDCMSAPNVNNRNHENEFIVSPTAVTLTPPLLNEATVMISSSSSTAQPFETMLSPGDFFYVIPNEGMIPAGRAVLLKIQCKKNINDNVNGLLQIYTANERHDIIVGIMSGKR